MVKYIYYLAGIIFILSLSFIDSVGYCNPNLPGGQNCEITTISTTSTGNGTTTNIYNNTYYNYFDQSLNTTDAVQFFSVLSNFSGIFNFVANNWFNWNYTYLAFNESKLATIYFNATESLNVTGKIDGGYLSDTQHQDGDYDGKTINFSERATAPALDLRINFTGVSDFNQGIMRYKTSVLSGSNPIVQVWDYNEGVWEDYPAVAQSLSFVVLEQPVFDAAHHIQNGIVQMRIYKSGNGNVNNKYYVDWVALAKGYGTPSGQEVDPLSYHKDKNINATYYNITADIFFTNTNLICNLTSCFTLQELNTTGSGGSGTPAGIETSVQYNDGASFGGDGNLTWNKTSQVLTINRRFEAGGGSIGEYAWDVDMLHQWNCNDNLATTTVLDTATTNNLATNSKNTEDMNTVDAPKAGESSLYFDGTDYISSATTMSLTGTDFSISMWIKPDEVSWYAPNPKTNHQELISFGDSPEGLWCGAWSTDNSTYNVIGANEEEYNTSIGIVNGAYLTITKGEWNHIVFIWDEELGTTSAWLNGELVRETTLSFSGFNNLNVKIGNGMWGRGFQGLISNVIFSNKAWTPREVAVLYRQTDATDFYDTSGLFQAKCSYVGTATDYDPIEVSEETDLLVQGDVQVDGTLYIKGQYRLPRTAPTVDGMVMTGDTDGRTLWKTFTSLSDNTGAISVNGNTRNLIRSDTTNASNWESSILLFADGLTTSLNWNSGLTYDSSGYHSIDWVNRILYQTDAYKMLDWGDYDHLKLYSGNTLIAKTASTGFNPEGAGAFDLGDSTDYWDDLFIDGIITAQGGTLTFADNTASRLFLDADELTPQTNNEINLGTTSNRYITVNAYNGDYNDGTTSVAINDDTEALSAVYGSVSAQLATSTVSGSFTDGTRTAYLADSTNAGTFSDGTNTANLGTGTYGVDANLVNAGTGYYVGGIAGITDQYDSTAGGSVTATAGIVTALTDDPSDEKFKNMSTNLTLNTSLFNKLIPSEWVWKDINNGTGYGLIAQELALVYPQLVKDGKRTYFSHTNIFYNKTTNRTTYTPVFNVTKYKTIDFMGVMGLQIKKIQELEVENTKLKAELDKMKQEMCIVNKDYSWCKA